MTLTDANNTAISFRRPSFPVGIYFTFANQNDLFLTGSDSSHLQLAAKDILATDYILNEPSVTVSRTQLSNAITNLVNSSDGLFRFTGDPIDLSNMIAPLLGL